jgi:hypothetical protein
VFGSSFNTNGLGGVLTCGVTGMGAGLSHSPVSTEGRERYVFFAFPHCAVDETGKLGAISRPNRPGESCACGAMAASLAQLKADGVEHHCREAGVHDPLDPEFSILKQRLARRIRSEKLEPANMNLADITNVAERVISDVRPGAGGGAGGRGDSRACVWSVPAWLALSSARWLPTPPLVLQPTLPSLTAPPLPSPPPPHPPLLGPGVPDLQGRGHQQGRLRRHHRRADPQL